MATLVQPKIERNKLHPASGVRVHSFQIVRPPHVTLQEDGLKWLTAAHVQAETSRRASSGEPPVEAGFANTVSKLMRRYGCSPEKIHQRGHELADHLHEDWQKMLIYKLAENHKGAPMSVRSQVFASGALRAVEEMYATEKHVPDDLIHVTCTGYVSPSAAQLFTVQSGWQQQTRVTHAYHMGCYASLPAIRIASGFLASTEKQNHRVDVVHNELCTLHLDPSDHSAEQLVVQSLFADGHIKYSLSKDGTANANDASGFRILALAEEIVPDSAEDMKWAVSEWGFRMGLSRDVPAKIGALLPKFLTRMFAQVGLVYEDERDSAIFAIHPGGPKIIEQVSDALGIRVEQSVASRKVLYNYGNMSSATLPHVWNEILQSNTAESGQLVVSLAFGPGLTVCGGLFQIE